MKLTRGTVVADRYEIVEQIGFGGMAVVYRAKDTKLDRFVTFKVMREDYIFDEEFKSKFETEARAAASLSNQNIVSIYDVGQEGLIRYIVMEYIDGVTLKELIKKRAPFEDDEILGVAIQIATALEHAHKHNIVHRDIKPQNILVTNNGDVKVTDFGIARASSASTVTISSNTMGSVHYFSPEQARGGYIDDKSDIYSLGLVMFEMATGIMPYDGDTPVSIALKHINDPLPDMKKLNPNIAESVIKITSKATEKISAKRYSSASFMLKDLKRALTYFSGEFEVNYDDIQNSPTLKISQSDIDEIKREAKISLFTDDLENKIVNNNVKSEKRSAKSVIDKSEKKVVAAAILTSALIILLVSVIGYFILFYNFGIPSFDSQVLIGKTVTEANELTQSYNITVVETGQEYNNQFESGLIVRLDTDENTTTSTINVVTSLGAEMFTVPDLINKDINEVYHILRDYNFTRNEEYVYDDITPINVVINQYPLPNELVEANSEIKLYISQGEEVTKVIVPKVVGLTDANAIELLQSMGLTVGHSTTTSSNTVPDGHIITQSVEAGSIVSRGHTINYVISTGPEEAQQPVTPDEETSVSSKKILEVDAVILPGDGEKVNLRILQISNGLTTEFFDGIVEVSQFPLNFEVESTGIVEYRTYLSQENGNENILQGSRTIDFSKGATE